MAQVQEITNEGLKRAFSITLPKELIEKGMIVQLEEIGKTAKIPGFRPGKIPMPVLKQRYGSTARAEALDGAISEATQKTLSERNLRPAMQPKIDLVSIAEDKDIEFKLEVEILPEVVPGDFSKISLERSIADVEDKTIDEAITRVAKASREPEIVTEIRAAQIGDMVIIDFDGSIDGVSRPGMKGSDHRLELGSKSFIDTFEEQLVGSKVGDQKTIKVTFPNDYHAADLSGKQADFAVTIKELRTPKAVTMDDDLAKDLGFPSLEKLRERVREDIATNYTSISRAIIKRQLMDKLAEEYKFEVPNSMLEAEFGNIWQQVEASKARGELPEADQKKSDEELRKEYRSIAERRIRLGLLLAEIARQQKIDVEPTELRNALMAEARRFPGQEKAVIDYYTQTEGAVERLRAPLLEEKVVDHIVSKAKVTETKISAEELMKLPGEDD